MPSEAGQHATLLNNSASDEMQQSEHESCCIFSPCFSWIFGSTYGEVTPPTSSEARSPGHVEANSYLYQAPAVSPFVGVVPRYEEERALIPKASPSSAFVVGGSGRGSNAAKLEAVQRTAGPALGVSQGTSDSTAPQLAPQALRRAGSNMSLGVGADSPKNMKRSKIPGAASTTLCPGL
eukprot:gene1037-3899_t